MQLFHDATFQLMQRFGYSPNEQVCKIFDQIYHHNNNIVPINLMDQIAELSYQMEHFELLIKMIVRGLKGYGPNEDSILKTLIVTDYLLKYGCSAIIDELKGRVMLFRDLSEFKINASNPLYQLIRQKSSHIAHQLTNRALLYKEKELAKQIKIKLQINKQQRQQSMEGNGVNNADAQNLDDWLENNVFKYLDSINDKLDNWGDVINQKLDSVIENLSNEPNLQQDEIFYPESCMDEIQIVSRPVHNIEFDYNKVKPHAPIVLPKQDLMQFDPPATQTKVEINLLD